MMEGREGCKRVDGGRDGWIERKKVCMKGRKEGVEGRTEERKKERPKQGREGRKKERKKGSKEAREEGKEGRKGHNDHHYSILPSLRGCTE
jgi:hypothetical protein